MRPPIEFEPEKHLYRVFAWEEWQTDFPSVTQVVKATVPVPFSAGAWYGYGMGCSAAWEIARATERAEWDEDYEWFLAAAKKLENPNSVLTKAGDRGTLVHQAIEDWGQSGKAPDPQDFEPEDRKRIAGVAKWLLENDPEFHAQEVRTANLEFRYVGTFDAIVTFGAGEHKGKRALLDWKTSKRVYPDQHFPQLAAYVAAEAEAGYPDGEPEFSAVVHIPESGRVKLHESVDTFEDFEVLLDQYRRGKLRELRMKEAKA